MTTDRTAERHDAAELQQAVALAALGVLVFSSLVGLWMATLLIWPNLATLAGPFTYGRWAPLHLDLQLYGWCSLPAVGLLLRRMLPSTAQAVGHARLALAGWLGALAAGALSWLSGDASGKLFLDWNGVASIAFALSQLFLWGVLVAGWRERGRLGLDGRWHRIADALLLAVLFAVPFVLWLATSPGIYPPVNPDSGGATGHSLLASSLGIIAIGLALPLLLSRPGVRDWRRPGLILVGIYACAWVVHALIGHGDASHHASDQIAGLATLLIWPPLLAWWFTHFAWEETHRRWIGTAGFWAVFLVCDGLFLFLPGVLEQAKFTNALVAHSHLAMAGLLTSLNLLMLISLAPRTWLATVLASRGPWLSWNIGCMAMIVLLTILGFLEGRWSHEGITRSDVVRDFYVLRWVAGLAMTGAAGVWLGQAVRARAAHQVRREVTNVVVA